MRFIDPNLESQPWKIVNDQSVNPVPVDAMFAEKINDELEVFISSSKPYGGALAHCPRPVPMINGTVLPYLGLDMQVKIPAAAAQLMRCLETDCKVAVISAPNGATPIQNLCDFSTQIKLFDGNKIQIDDQNQHWIDTGLAVPSLPIDTWFSWSGRFKIDVANKKFSVLAFIINGATYTVPQTLQGLNWQTTNWGQAVEPSLQLDDNTVPGAFAVEYRGITLIWDDQPIP